MTGLVINAFSYDITTKTSNWLREEYYLADPSVCCSYDSYNSCQVKFLHGHITALRLQYKILRGPVRGGDKMHHQCQPKLFD